ncbi:hypothetical protein ACRCUN_23475 [Mycobacterium sp. LTG2003]
MKRSSDNELPFEQRSYQVFNPRRTIGVKAAFGGATTGVFLSEAVSYFNERILAQQILEVAAVASMRGRLALREKMDEAAEAADNTVGAGTYELLDSVPTTEEYERFKRETLR